MDKVDEFLNELVFVTFIANKFSIQFCCMSQLVHLIPGRLCLTRTFDNDIAPLNSLRCRGTL